MFIEFKITNFRSIKDEQVVSFLPSARLKTRKNSLIKSDDYKGLKLLSTCVIYGPNNSGKSNTLHAFRALKFLVENSHRFNLGDKLEPNESFKFDVSSQKEPTTFQIEFIAKDKIRYDYLVSFDKDKIHKEELSFYPNPDSDKLKASRLFKRFGNEFSYGENFKGAKKSVESELLENQLFLSKAVQNKVEQLNPVYQYFRNHIGLSIFHDTDYDEILLRNLGEFIYNNKDEAITTLIEKFIINSDTGIVGIEAIPEKDIPQIQFPDDFPEKEKEKLREEFIRRFQYQILTQHRLFENNKEIGITTLPLKEQSTGTKKFFSMLRLVLVALKDGDLLIVDELDKSLHTEWTQLLINLFHDPDTNPNNAQLIFATHDTNLFSSRFDRDQIYLIEKDRFGASQLSALSSYSGLRKDTPIEKWYLSGRFGAVPQIYKSLLNRELQNSPVFHE